MSKTKVLILGGAGYVGGGLTDYILSHPDKDNYEFIVYDNLTFEKVYGKPFRLIQEDVRNEEVLNHYIDWCDVCISLAASVGDSASAIWPEVTYDLNVEIPRKIRARMGNKRIITISSCSIYGINNDLIDESAAPNPQSLYGTTKVLMEKELAGSNSLIFRLGTLYGISDKYSRLRLDLVANTLIKNAYYNHEMKVFGGEQWRPILHVRDVAKAIWDGFTVNKDKRGIYNLSSENVKIVELAQKINSFIPESKLELTEIKTEDARNYRVSNEKAVKELGFAPSLTLEDAIKEFLELFYFEAISQAMSPTATPFDPNSSRFFNDRWLRANKELLNYDKDYGYLTEKLKGIQLTSVI